MWIWILQVLKSVDSRWEFGPELFEKKVVIGQCIVQVTIVQNFYNMNNEFGTPYLECINYPIKKNFFDAHFFWQIFFLHPFLTPIFLTSDFSDIWFFQHSIFRHCKISDNLGMCLDNRLHFSDVDFDNYIRCDQNVKHLCLKMLKGTFQSYDNQLLMLRSKGNFVVSEFALTFLSFLHEHKNYIPTYLPTNWAKTMRSEWSVIINVI